MFLARTRYYELMDNETLRQTLDTIANDMLAEDGRHTDEDVLRWEATEEDEEG